MTSEAIEFEPNDGPPSTKEKFILWGGLIFLAAFWYGVYCLIF